MARLARAEIFDPAEIVAVHLTSQSLLCPRTYRVELGYRRADATTTAMRADSETHDTPKQPHGLKNQQIKQGNNLNPLELRKNPCEELGECLRLIQKQTKPSNSNPLILVKTKPMVTIDGIQPMIRVHYRSSYLYGLLVKENFVGTVVKDILGYSKSDLDNGRKP